MELEKPKKKGTPQDVIALVTPRKLREGESWARYVSRKLDEADRVLETAMRDFPEHQVKAFVKERILNHLSKQILLAEGEHTRAELAKRLNELCNRCK